MRDAVCDAIISSYLERFASIIISLISSSNSKTGGSTSECLKGHVGCMIDSGK